MTSTDSPRNSKIMLSITPSCYNADTLFFLSYSRGGRLASNKDGIPTFRKKDLSREK